MAESMWHVPELTCYVRRTIKIFFSAMSSVKLTSNKRFKRIEKFLYKRTLVISCHCNTLTTSSNMYLVQITIYAANQTTNVRKIRKNYRGARTHNSICDCMYTEQLHPVPMCKQTQLYYGPSSSFFRSSFISLNNFWHNQTLVSWTVTTKVREVFAEKYRF